MKDLNPRNELSRRGFVQAATSLGGLVIGIHLPGPQALGGTLASEAAGGSPSEVFSPNAWLRIFPDNRIVFVLDKTEMGQGVMTALPMLVAEELEIAAERMEIINAPADRAYKSPTMGLQVTGGSTSVAASWEPLRQAGAVARQMLIAAAAKRWNVAETSCSAVDGKVVHSESGREATYGELALAASSLPVPQVKLKEPHAFRVIGTSPRRLDNLPKVTGKATFGIDVNLPDLLAACVKHCPALGGKVVKFDKTSIEHIPGIEAVLEVPSGVAIVAKKYWQARQAASLLQVEWDYGDFASLSTDMIFADYDRQAKETLAKVVNGDEAAKALKAGAKQVQATYQLPYLAHAAMEPINCTAHVTDSSCEVWCPTQAPGLAQQLAAEVTGLPHDQVRIHTTYIGGGFGRRLYQDYVVEAVEIARRIKKPVKVIWSREDDMRHDFYRPATVHELSAAIDDTGKVAAWTHAIVGQSILVQTLPEWLRAILPVWLPEGLKALAGRTAGGVLRLLGDDQTSREGADDMPYQVGHVAVEYKLIDKGLPVGFWRSVGHSYTGFVVESFVDELAHAARVDPLIFRRHLLAEHPRHRGVLDLVAEKAGWNSPAPQGVFRGIAQHKSFGSFVAQIAEVSIDDEGAVKIHRIVCTIDCGRVVHPDLVAAQVESAILFGLSAALYGKITVSNGIIDQSNFHDYQVVRFNETPKIEVHMVTSEEEPSGVGEPGLPPVAPAIANAIFAASGKRLRSLPLNLQSPA